MTVQASHTQAWHIVKPHKWRTNFPAHGKQTSEMRTLELSANLWPEICSATVYAAIKPV